MKSSIISAVPLARIQNHLQNSATSWLRILRVVCWLCGRTDVGEISPIALVWACDQQHRSWCLCEHLDMKHYAPDSSIVLTFATFCNHLRLAYERVLLFIKSAQFLERTEILAWSTRSVFAPAWSSSSSSGSFVTSLTHFSITWRLNNIGMNRSSKIYNG